MSGTVQGTGVRPFVHRLASRMQLAGWVGNSSSGVTLEVEGPRARIEEFLERVSREHPSAACPQGVQAAIHAPLGYHSFEIRESLDGAKSAAIAPDLATCPECLAELFDPVARRYRYPFVTCTQCGPRFSIVESIPYDRCNTTMRAFELCGECLREYRDPADRRFHAQSLACPQCGPQLSLRDGKGNVIAVRGEAMRFAADCIRRGEIVALKGIGGFQLIVDARSEIAVARLRERKARPEKPFAVMFPDFASIANACEVSALEERWLRSPQAPIVLLRRKDSKSIADGCAPQNPEVGAMLPCSPLHHLLMRELSFAVICTSGNRTSEPICIDDAEAFERLRGIADVLLTHDRRIARPIDDSVLRVVLDRELVLRRARGFAPTPLRVPGLRPGVLAAGAQMKNTVALSLDGTAVLSQHIGDLTALESRRAFTRATADLQRLYGLTARAIACDAHPDYAVSKFAAESGREVKVQHHYAHVLSCMAENELKPPVLGVAWDGTGFGTDGTIWGGEFLSIELGHYERIAHFRTFGLPGGEQAIEEPRRAALGLLFELRGDSLFESHNPALAAFSPAELKVLRGMLARSVNVPRTSSIGRLCDALASIVGLRQRVSFEGQAAMELEFAAQQGRLLACAALERDDAYEIKVCERAGSAPLVLDWAPMVEAILADLNCGVQIGCIATRVHNALVEAIIAVARRTSLQCVALSGGCFQNRYLLEQSVQQLRREGLQPFWHRQVPPNDGGLALGQLVASGSEMG